MNSEAADLRLLLAKKEKSASIVGAHQVGSYMNTLTLQHVGSATNRLCNNWLCNKPTLQQTDAATNSLCHTVTLAPCIVRQQSTCKYLTMHMQTLAQSEQTHAKQATASQAFAGVDTKIASTVTAAAQKAGNKENTTSEQAKLNNTAAVASGTRTTNNVAICGSRSTPTAVTSTGASACQDSTTTAQEVLKEALAANKTATVEYGACVGTKKILRRGKDGMLDAKVLYAIYQV
jgi:hypothetical protein